MGNGTPVSIDELRALPAQKNRFATSHLTEEEWLEVFAAIARGVRQDHIYEAFAKYRGYKSLRGFYRAVANRRRNLQHRAEFRNRKRA
jgi:hypothetical protein